jgi:hypothetical protein
VLGVDEAVAAFEVLLNAFSNRISNCLNASAYLVLPS